MSVPPPPPPAMKFAPKKLPPKIIPQKRVPSPASAVGGGGESPVVTPATATTSYSNTSSTLGVGGGGNSAPYLAPTTRTPSASVASVGGAEGYGPSGALAGQRPPITAVGPKAVPTPSTLDNLYTNTISGSGRPPSQSMANNTTAGGPSSLYGRQQHQEVSNSYAPFGREPPTIGSDNSSAASALLASMGRNNNTQQGGAISTPYNNGYYGGHTNVAGGIGRASPPRATTGHYGEGISNNYETISTAPTATNAAEMGLTQSPPRTATPPSSSALIAQNSNISIAAFNAMQLANKEQRQQLYELERVISNLTRENNSLQDRIASLLDCGLTPEVSSYEAYLASPSNVTKALHRAASIANNNGIGSDGYNGGRAGSLGRTGSVVGANATNTKDDDLSENKFLRSRVKRLEVALQMEMAAREQLELKCVAQQSALTQMVAKHQGRF